MPEQSHQGSCAGRADVTNLVGHVQDNSVGPHRFADPVRMFADPDAGPDEVSFHQPNLDEQYYNSGTTSGIKARSSRSRARRQTRPI